jgi:molecular chaperone GrpE
MKNRKDEKPIEAEESGDVPATEAPLLGESADAVDVAELVRERDEALANWKRATADYQNLRRRLQSDIDSAVALRKAGLLADLLLVLDYLDMALATPVSTAEGKNIHAGVEATRSALLGTLEREGVRPLPEGGRFDPAVHACVAREDARDREPGEILQTLRRGYTFEGRILRPAQVRVAGEIATAGQQPETDSR